MLALPGILLLILFTYVRPQEWSPGLDRIPWLYLWLGMAVLGLAVDLGTRRLHLKMTPQLPWVLAVMGLAVVSLFIRGTGAKANSVIQLLNVFILYFLIAHAVKSFAQFQILAVTILATGLFIAGVGVHQGFSPKQCVVQDLVITEDGSPGRTDSGTPDGRDCETVIDCRQHPDADPEANYWCERVGAFKTHSIGAGRVRWRGVLQDPNELALTVGVVIPFALALVERKRSFLRVLLLMFTVAVVGTCTVLSQSRGGQLVFACALGAYFVKRFGKKGVIAAGIAAVPLLLLGGRSGDEASASSEERIECMSEGLRIWKSFPVLGCGYHQFEEHHFLTAHNSYLLALSELGPFGLFAWSAIVYLSIKIPYTALKREFAAQDEGFIHAWSMALIASFSGMLIGIFFLSFSYHSVLWMYFGLAGALFTVVKTRDPEFAVKLGWKDAVVVAGIDAALVVMMFVYTSMKGFSAL
jgi:hypothetical protein